MTIKFYFYLLVSLLALIAFSNKAVVVKENASVKVHTESNENLITNDGNFLFYNSPIAADTGPYRFIAYLDRLGVVVVRKYKKNHGDIVYVEQYNVHDYADVINKNNGLADDHAAPALIYDNKNDRIILATAYHGTKLFIYEYSLSDSYFLLLKVINGSYTYPRLIEWKDNVYLFTRLQLKGIKAGDFVVRSSNNDFSTERVVIKSVDGEVVYASRPTLSESGIYITYSLLRSSTRSLHGWQVVNYDPQANRIIEKYNLAPLLDYNYFSNRPTAIAYKDGRLMVGTAFFADKQQVTSRFFSRQNTVMIVEKNIRELSDFVVRDANIVTAPYYHTSVAFDADLNWLYFDKSKVYSNMPLSNYCFNYLYMMYPNFHKGDVYFAVVNDGYYEIRKFHNSIIRCVNE